MFNIYRTSHVPGNPSAMGTYSVENASERDFLRTEGDPGALGYTIKEAIALTRSVVGYYTIHYTPLHTLEDVSVLLGILSSRVFPNL